MHKLHHSQLRIETDSNYATVFSCWDRLFGTYRQREDYREIQFGLPNLDAERFQTVKGLILTPFRRL
jgi:sterol desaturase/sphingolipid hydroxylase (fatty acid hydroxylase superfamily)